jgi:hypothetical protein
MINFSQVHKMRNILLGSEIDECCHQESLADKIKKNCVSIGTQFDGYRAQVEEIERSRELRFKSAPKVDWNKVPEKKLRFL